MAGDFGRYEQANQRTVPGTLLVTAGVLGSPSSWGSAVEQTGNDLLDGGRGNDRLVTGGDGDDQMFGSTGSDVLDGGPGNDAIDGGRGNDRAYGRDGDDTLTGGAGRDGLYGSAGADHLDFVVVRANTEGLYARAGGIAHRGSPFELATEESLNTRAGVERMADDAIVFAMANPDPEVTYDVAVETRKDIIMATGRSDYPNQVNNVLGFPYLFRGALDVGATTITTEMEVAAVQAIADLAQAETSEQVSIAYGIESLSFGPEYVIPKPFDPRLISRIAPAVAKAAMASGVATRPSSCSAETTDIASVVSR